MVESNLTCMDDQKLGGNDLIFVRVLFMLMLCKAVRSIWNV